MTQQPFSRPGAIDLSALQGPPATDGPTGTTAAPGGPAAAPATAGGSAYCVEVTEQNLQDTVEQSRTAPVLLVFYSPSRLPESVDLADDLETLSAEFEGKFLAARINIDAAPQIAQAMQIPSIPLVLAVVDGRPMPLLQDVVPLEELRTALTQVMQQLTTQGVAGRHQPRTAVPQGEDEEVEEAADPRYAAAQDALGEGDIDRAVAEYQKLVDANPADAEAAAGLAMAKVLQRTVSADPNQVRTAAAERPDDVEAQTLAADLDLLGGHVDDAFGRLIDLVRRTSGDERDQARTHLLGLFAAVGNEDPRVLKGRQNLANALF